MKRRMIRYSVVAVLALIPAVAVGAAPKVAKTVPAANAADVDPAITEIVIVFDAAMKAGTWSIVQAGDATMPEMVGDEPITFKDERTCIVKVKLEADKSYGLGINSKTRKGFKSAADETPAEPFQLLFKTGSGKPAESEGPRVVKTDPVKGTDGIEPGTYDLTLVFSEPMKPGQASLITPADGPHLKILGKPAWKDSRTFVVPVMLASGTKYRIGVNVGENRKFVSAGDGTPAAPFEWTFSTSGAITVPGVGEPREKADEPEAPPTKRGAVSLRYNYQKGDTGRVLQKKNLDIRLKLSTGQTIPVAVQKAGMNSIEEVTAAEKGRPVRVQRIISEFVMQVADQQTGQMQSAPRIEQPVVVKIDRSEEPAKVEAVEGEPSEELMSELANESFVDLLPAKAIKVGDTFDAPEETVADLKKAFDTQGTGNISVKLTCRRIGPMEVADARNEMFKAKGGGKPVTYVFDVAEFDLDWKQDGSMENNVNFTLAAKGQMVFAIEAGVLLKLKMDGKINFKPMQVNDENGQVVTITGGGTIATERTFEPIKWARGAKQKSGEAKEPPDVKSEKSDEPTKSPKAEEKQKKEEQEPACEEDQEKFRPDKQEKNKATEEPSAKASPGDGKLPAGWLLMDDKLFGTQIAVPPGWTPRVRGDVAMCVEPDAVPRAGAFFLPMLLKPGVKPDALADGFDEMLRRGLKDYSSDATGKPTAESVQRKMEATINNATFAGMYRAVVSKNGVGFVMGYLAPQDKLDELQPTFYRILKSYRYTGPRMRLQPFKSAAVELKAPPGWLVRTSEGNGLASHDIDWEVTCPQMPGVRAFMVSPKYITPNWVCGITGQVDPQQLAIWQHKGFQAVPIASDEQAMQTALQAVLPGLEIIRQQSLEEIREAFRQLQAPTAQLMAQTGTRMDNYVYEIHGRREINGTKMRLIVYLGMSAMVTPMGMKGDGGMWNVSLRGFEAPVDKFAQWSPTLERVAGSFCYTMWWIQQVHKANEQEARKIRELWAYSNKVDREIWDNRNKTNSAIHEMMYDFFTDNYAYVNKETGSIEKIPSEQVDRFRDENGRVVSPEELLDKKIDPNWATRLRQANVDDYMNFDRRVQVWP